MRAQTRPTCSDADITQDNTVDLNDLAILVREIFKSPFSPARVDINKDGSVDIQDYTIFLSFVFDTCTSTPPSPTTSPDPANLPAFPGAEGFGAKAKGGRGGKVVRVTNLNDSGVGSLRQALEVETGPRTIVFTTGGTIELSKPLRLIGNNGSYVTIAGQTAPGGGIQLKNYGLNIYNGAHDVVVRYLRIRVGQRANYNYRDDNDAIEIWGGTTPVYNVIVDHVSAQWALDENISVYDAGRDITFQYNLIAESSDDGQDHIQAKGLLVGNDDPTKLPNNISLHHNVFANNYQRNPRIAFADTDMRNNVIYNWGADNSTNFGNYHDASLSNLTRVNIVGNLWKKGPSSKASENNMIWVNKNAKIYVQGNRGPNCAQGCGSNEWSIGLKEEFEPYRMAAESVYRVTQPFGFPTVTTQDAGTLMNTLLPEVGASLPARDAVDTRIIQQVTAGTGSTGIGSGFPTLATGSAPQDADQDGMPDSWETSKGLSSSDASDAVKVSPSGYTWIEEYINSLVP